MREREREHEEQKNCPLNCSRNEIYYRIYPIMALLPPPEGTAAQLQGLQFFLNAVKFTQQIPQAAVNQMKIKDANRKEIFIIYINSIS